MENLTHSLVGGLIAQTTLGTRLRYATPILIVAANLPDADVVTQLVSRTAYFQYHRGITHAAVGVLISTVLVSGLLLGLGRFWPAARGAPNFQTAFWPIFLALLSHPILDWTNNYGIRPWLPWSGRWYYGDLVFIADPWLWLLLGGGLALVTTNTKPRIIFWSLLALLLTALLLWLSLSPANILPRPVLFVWLAGLIGIVGLRWLRPDLNAPTVALLAFAGLVIYWALLGISQQRAWQQAERSSAILGPVMQLDAYALPGNPFGWSCVAETPDAIYQLSVSALSGSPDWRTAERLPKEANAEMLAAIRTSAAGQSFLNFARIYTSTVTERADGYQVILRDQRFNLTLFALLDKNQRVRQADFGNPPK